MRIGVFSDIHDNIWKLAAALQALESSDVLVCCGDLCSPFIIHQIGRAFPRPVHIVFGNNDGDLYRITVNAARYPHLKLHGEFFRSEFDGRQVAAVHYDTLARPIIRSGEFDAVFFGHNHVYELEQCGRTLAVNPGPILGAKFAPDGSAVDVPSTFIVYDTAAGAASGFSVDQAAGISAL